MNKILIYIVSFILLLSAAFYIGKISNTDDADEISRLNHNIAAMNDSVLYYKDINAYEKTIFLAKEAELNNLLNISSSQLDSVEEALNKTLIYVSELESNISIDTVYISDIEVEESGDSINMNFAYGDQWLSFNGKLSIDSTYTPYNFNIYNIIIPATLQVGLTKENTMYVKSDNPYMNITDIRGAYIIDNIINKPSLKPKWSHGISFGFGVQYGILNKDIDIGPQISYAILYNF